MSTLDALEHSLGAVLTETTDVFRALVAERDALLAAIRRHRDYRGDDRCHLDDGELYAVLPEGDTRPDTETAVTLENCAKFLAARQQGRTYVSPERELDRLRALLDALALTQDRDISRAIERKVPVDDVTPALDTGRRLKTLDGGVRLQVRLSFCRCTPPVPHATDDGVCGMCGNAIRRVVGVPAEGESPRV